ncbi:MAG TPA: hypothetical protein VI942_03135 [Thermoanaerobaculia bacterium]|nr:hypothetical protein [Thermoanaerobaculia bacterium]
MRRDWAAVEAAKLADWAERKRRLTADEALAIASGLRQRVRNLRPDWPTEREREEDLAAHVELSRRLRLAHRRSQR